MAQLARSIVRTDAKLFFADHYESILQSWVSLLRCTNLPENIPGTDNVVKSAFQTLDRIILAKDDTAVPVSRLAYVSLFKLRNSLKDIVDIGRSYGRIRGEPGYRNASIVYDLYVDAQQNVSGKNTQKQLHENIDKAQR